jgi:hypothetical protein
LHEHCFRPDAHARLSGEEKHAMKYLLLLAVAGGSMLPAQYMRPYRSDLFDHVDRDLHRAASDSYPNGKMTHALHEFDAFRVRYNTGQPAKHELDHAIAAVRDLTKSDVLRPADRNVLENDLISMRQFRENYRAGVY